MSTLQMTCPCKLFIWFYRMPPINDVMKLCCELSANQQIKTAVKGSMKGSAAAGGLAFAGGMLGGPLGIAVGM